ncbi:hypothetical protein ACFE04_028715 [Oxalis oulophora]
MKPNLHSDTALKAVQERWKSLINLISMAYEQCVPLLEGSVHILLDCLETANNDLVVCFAWNTQEAVKCASFLRRIYEELRQHKDIFDKHYFKFLASYIRVYSGYGSHKTGIAREVDAALRPGVYALMDSCSPDNLQYLYTTLGAGPCGNTLASLQQDYKQNFKCNHIKDCTIDLVQLEEFSYVVYAFRVQRLNFTVLFTLIVSQCNLTSPANFETSSWRM